jgi:hypothetical protein
MSLSTACRVARLRPLLAVLALASACGKKGGEGAAAASASASADKPVAAEVDALARAVLGCKAFGATFDASCPAMKAWSDAKDPFSEGRADAALVAMLGHPDEKLRYLGAYKLNQQGKAFKTDPKLAEAVVAAAEREKSNFCGYELGASVGHVLVGETRTFDRVGAMVRKHPVPDLRRGIVANLLFYNQDYDPAFELVRETVKDGDKAVAQQALGAFWTGSTRRGEQTCPIYAENLENPNEDLASEANNYLAWFGQCSSRYDDLLASLEKRVKAGRVGSSSYLTAARHVCEDTKSSDKQKKRAAEIGRAVAGKGDFQPWIRVTALDTVMKCDPGSGGSAFVAKLKSDPEKAVADKATELLGAK